MDSNGALHGIKVVDLSRVLGGPFCAQILGDHGANVIKIEPPQGDETRGWGPPFADGVASYFLGLNRNKLGCVLDLSQPTGREEDRKSTRLNSSHTVISYAVFCLKKKTKELS